MASLSRNAIVGRKGRIQTVRISTPEWGDKNDYVYVRQFRADEAGDVQSMAEQAKGDANQSAAIIRWCILGVCDAKGKRTFTDSDFALLSQGPLAPVYRCAMEAMRLNGITDETATDRKKN